MAWRYRLAYLFLGALTLAALGAEVISNDRPLVLKYRGHLYLPALTRYHASVFGVTDRVRMDFKELPLGAEDWAWWAPNPWGPRDSNQGAGLYPAPPGRGNLLGTDDRGRDVLARLIYGYRNSLGFAVLVWLLTTSIAIVVGSLAGFFGGRVDFLSQRAVELVTSVPQLFVLVYLVSLFTPSLGMLVAVSGLLGWTYMSGYVRTEVLQKRQMLFVEAARANGAGILRVLFRHVLPNALGPLWTLAPFGIVDNISALAALDFLGFGLPPPTASWGELLAQGHQYFSTAWWLAVFPTLALFLTLLSITLVGEHVRERSLAKSHA